MNSEIQNRKKTMEFFLLRYLLLRRQILNKRDK